jgi:DNA-directed RNA polymerase subunit RPC12/RpoP
MEKNNKLMYCPDCGHQISTKAKSCPNCGHPVTFEERPKEVTKMTLGKFFGINVGTFFLLYLFSFLLSLILGNGIYLIAALVFLFILIGTFVLLLKDNNISVLKIFISIILPFIVLVYLFSWMGMIYFLLIWGVILIIGHIKDYQKGKGLFKRKRI